jgi:hypothetical protein
MVKNILKSALPHLIAVAIFALVAIIYCRPALEGKVLQQSDNIQWKGMSHSQQMEAEATGKVPLWNNGMFGGMPGYLIMMPKLYNDVPYYFSQVLTLGLPKPINFFVLACICFYILSLVVGANPYIGILTALTYAFSTYNPIIVSVGHDTKMMAIALMPGVIAGVMLLFNKKYLAGVVVTSLFVGALITTKHYQIAFYTILIILFSSIAFAIKAIVQKDFKHLLLVAVFGISAALLGVGSNIINLKTDAEYSASSIRGGSQLPAKGTGVVNDKGLGKEYALSYSYQIMEPFVLMVPKLYGGSSDHLEISEEKSKISELGVPNFKGYYWGGIVESTSGPAYAGILIFILALFSLFIIKKQHSFWILSLFAFTILLSYGKYLIGFNYWMLDHLPIYNKFRAPSMISVIQIFLINFTAVLGLIEIVKTENQNKLKPALYKTLIAAGILFVVCIIFYLTTNFKGGGQADSYLLNASIKSKDPNEQGQAISIYKALIADRQTILFNSLLKSILIALTTLALIWLFISKKIQFLNYKLLLVVFAVIGLLDLMNINSTYLNSESFIDKEVTNNTYLTPSQLDLEIQKDKSDYRVLDVSMGGLDNAFNGGAITAYFHNTIGGYHPAKLSLMQDLIVNQIRETYDMNDQPTGMPEINASINMLNTKYIIDNKGQASINHNALGSAWFVKGVQMAKDPSAEMNALTNLNTKDYAVMNVVNQESLKAINGIDSTASIKLTAKSNDALAYQTNSKNTQLAVFSEIYYDKGWKAYIDDKEAPILKANYLLRALVVPAGAHKIKFEFKPDAYYGYIKYAQICEWLTLLLILILIGTWVKEFRSKQIKN